MLTLISVLSEDTGLDVNFFYYLHKKNEFTKIYIKNSIENTFKRTPVL